MYMVSQLLVFMYMVSQLTWEFRDDLKAVVYFWYLMHDKEIIKTGLYVWRAFSYSGLPSLDLKNWNLFKLCNISVNFQDRKMVDHILKILRPSVFDIRCFYWIVIIAVMKKCRMDGRRYKGRHLIPMYKAQNKI